MGTTVVETREKMRRLARLTKSKDVRSRGMSGWRTGSVSSGQSGSSVKADRVLEEDTA